MKANVLTLLTPQRLDRVGRDRLELLHTLIGGPSFDRLYLPDVIKVPGQHPVLRWQCVVDACDRSRTGGAELCQCHQAQWAKASQDGVGKAAFVAAAAPVDTTEWIGQMPCRICPERPALKIGLRLCRHHHRRWTYQHGHRADEANLGMWLAGEQALAGYGTCQVTVCPDLADTPLGLCSGHGSRYRGQGQPGGAALPSTWWQSYESLGKPAPVHYQHRDRFRDWCDGEPPLPCPGQINLKGLRPLAAAEIRWDCLLTPAENAIPAGI